jgi:fructokinase
VDVVGYFITRLKLPISFDTDVNGAVLAEQIWGAGRGLRNIVYYTIGTGIGGGVILDDNLLHGALHGELGHMLIPHDRAVDPFEGACPFHGDCLEGLASGTSMEKRWQTSARNLPPDHSAWALEADYIAAALHNTICMLSPERIILGGGVISQTHLLPMVHYKLIQSLNGYMQLKPIQDGIENYVVRTPLEGKAGVLGAFALALSTQT